MTPKELDAAGIGNAMFKAIWHYLVVPDHPAKSYRVLCGQKNPHRSTTKRRIVTCEKCKARLSSLKEQD